MPNPAGRGCWSAIGFLKAPFGYEALASRLVRLSEFDVGAVNAMLNELRETAEGFVRAGTDGEIRREIVGFMRYRGQGWEIPVAIPDRALTGDDVDLIRDRFRDNYARFFGRAIDGLDGLEIEIVTWSVKASDIRPTPARQDLLTDGQLTYGADLRPVFDPSSDGLQDSRIVARETLSAGDRVEGPAVIVERETSTVVTTPFDAVLQGDGTILLIRKEG